MGFDARAFVWLPPCQAESALAGWWQRGVLRQWASIDPGNPHVLRGPGHFVNTPPADHW